MGFSVRKKSFFREFLQMIFHQNKEKYFHFSSEREKLIFDNERRR